MKRIFPLFLLFLIIISFVVIKFSRHCNNIHCIQFTNSDLLKEQDVYENTDMIYRALMAQGKIQIRTEIYSKVSQKEAENFTQIKKMKMQGLFENARSPYPGMLSNEIECGKKFLPIFKELTINDLKIQYMRGLLNERLQYGSCLDSEIKFIGHTALFYCQNQQKWYQVEMIMQSNENNAADWPLSILKSIRCVE